MNAQAPPSVSRGDRLIRWVFLLGRLAPLSQAALAGAGHLTGAWNGLYAVLAAETAVLLPMAATSLPDWILVAADVAVGTAVLADGAIGARLPDGFAALWAGLLYVVAMAAVLLRSKMRAITLAGFWVAAQMAISWARFGPAVLLSWRQLWQAAAQMGFMLLVCALAGEYRRINQALDRVVREAALAAGHERGRHYRLLHDRVLQTMETLARGRWITDQQIQDHVRGEARWLRQLISGELDDQPDDLNAALMLVIGAQAAAGLTVELHTGRPHPPVPAAAAEALSAAASEALTNVRKHAGVDRAVVSVLPARAGVLVTVVDDGRGFDPGQQTSGLGIRQSLHARMSQVSGTARLDTAPGQGTHVELWAPAARSARAARKGHR